MFHPLVQSWFDSTYTAPAACQLRAWDAIGQGHNTLVCAPTGSGKTLSAFLSAIDDLVRELDIVGTLPGNTRVLYVSPLKALSNDIEKNLRAPLTAINAALESRGLAERIEAAVRTGDTSATDRQRMKKRPPHILVTTPESLYILLTSDSGRSMLSTVATVIVDEIHALAPNKRGAHLSLSLERLQNLVPKPLLRIGLSATQRPLERVAAFLAGSDKGESVTIVADESERHRDIELLLPGSILTAVMAAEVWAEIYDQLANLASTHRTTLVFVNTRRLAERVARHLAERLGTDAVTSHHGSLSKDHRLDAENRLKNGHLTVLVATASLELGIDIGDVDLVCQLGSPRSVSAFLQRVGRSGHAIGRTPKGRLIPLSRDDLVECVALIDCVRRGELDETTIPDEPLDVLAQQIAAESAGGELSVDGTYAWVTRAMPYQRLQRDTFDAVLRMLSEGFSTRRGRRGALISVDLVNKRIHARKGTRLTALTNGGAIPDLFDYNVVMEPEGQVVGTLNEDFAFESLAGDIFQLGNTSYRILRIEGGTVWVADAHGQPPNIPFWFGEAPGRGDTLSMAVSRLRGDIETWMSIGIEHAYRQVMQTRGLDENAAHQLIDYLGAAYEALDGILPTRQKIVAERFFDDAGDMHLVIHSTFGSRINRAFGLALRKRFCRRFNFELQAAALEDCVVLSLGETHSFDLSEVAGYLSSTSVYQVLVQALLDAPVFPTHWRWVTNISLAVPRFRNGHKVPPQFQRSNAEDLVAVVFPDQLACVENIRGEREVPDHPLVNQAINDCLHDVMDIDGLQQVLKGLESGTIEWAARDLVAPSPLSDEIVNARPYAFLDDAPAEERRTRSVKTRLPDTGHEEFVNLVRIDVDAIKRVRSEAWPDPRDSEELHDALVCGGYLTDEELNRMTPDNDMIDELVAAGRITRMSLDSGEIIWTSVQRLAELIAIVPDAIHEPDIEPVGWDEPITLSAEQALVSIIRSRLEILGPVSIDAVARSLGLDKSRTRDSVTSTNFHVIHTALETLRQQGFAIAGQFGSEAAEELWCDRRLAARIHRYTMKSLRSRVEPVSLSAWLRFLFEWQHLDRTSRMEGVDGVAEVINQLEGAAVPLRFLESDILATRVRGYYPALLDQIALSGKFVWRRALTRPVNDSGRRGNGRAVGSMPVAFYSRGSISYWREGSGEPQCSISATADSLLEVLAERGASFYDELFDACGLLPVHFEEVLAELIAVGLITCDSFNGFRGLLIPQSRRRSPGRSLQRRSRRLSSNRIEQSGRWSLANITNDAFDETDVNQRDERMMYLCDALLHRYGVVSRAVVGEEKGLPPWREFAAMLRRMEARGEVRGGRFVAAFSGEQFALPEAVETLHRHRREPTVENLVKLHAADPLNMTGTILPGDRVTGNRTMVFRNGVLAAVRDDESVKFTGDFDEGLTWRIRELLLTSTRVTSNIGNKSFSSVGKYRPRIN